MAAEETNLPDELSNTEEDRGESTNISILTQVSESSSSVPGSSNKRARVENNEQVSEQDDEIYYEFEERNPVVPDWAEHCCCDYGVVVSNIDEEIANIDRMIEEDNKRETDESTMTSIIADDKKPELDEASKAKYGNKKVAIVAPLVSDTQKDNEDEDPFKRLFEIKSEYDRELNRYYQQFGMLPPPSEYLPLPWEIRYRNTEHMGGDINHPRQRPRKNCNYYEREVEIERIGQYIHHMWVNMISFQGGQHVERNNDETTETSEEVQSENEEDQNQDDEESDEHNSRKRKRSECWTDDIDITADGRISDLNDVVYAIRQLNKHACDYEVKIMTNCAKKVMDLNFVTVGAGGHSISIQMLQELSRLDLSHL